jgi:hypothetical protein
MARSALKTQTKKDNPRYPNYLCYLRFFFVSVVSGLGIRPGWVEFGQRPFVWSLTTTPLCGGVDLAPSIVRRTDRYASPIRL